VQTRLTQRQAEVMNLVTQGLCDREIADRLIVSPSTVKHHLKDIKIRSGESRRTALVAWWVNQDWIQHLPNNTSIETNSDAMTKNLEDSYHFILPLIEDQAFLSLTYPMKRQVLHTIAQLFDSEEFPEEFKNLLRVKLDLIRALISSIDADVQDVSRKY